MHECRQIGSSRVLATVLYLHDSVVNLIVECNVLQTACVELF